MIMPERRTIVVIDGSDDIRKYYRMVLNEHFKNKFQLESFSNYEDATAFIVEKNQEVIGFIQDLYCGVPDEPFAGVTFCRSVINVWAPWANNLTISALMDVSHIIELFQLSRSNFDFISKRELMQDRKSLQPALDRLVRPFAPPSNTRPATTASIASVLNRSWKELCRVIATNEQALHRMDARVFEEMAAEVFHSFGFQVELTSRTRDGGHDIIAVRRLGPSNIRLLIEAKRWAPNRRIGVDVVRSLYGIKQSNAASQLVLVTSSFVSADAKKEFARVIPWELSFFERDRLLEWCKGQATIALDGEFARQDN